MVRVYTRNVRVIVKYDPRIVTYCSRNSLGMVAYNTRNIRVIVSKCIYPCHITRAYCPRNSSTQIIVRVSTCDMTAY